MKSVSGAAIVIAILLSVITPTRANDTEYWDLEAWVHCTNSAQKPVFRIGNCTYLVESGRLKDSDLPHILHNRGLAYALSGKYVSAIQDFNEVLRLDPDDAGALINRGTAQIETKQFEEAIKSFDKALLLKPETATAFFNRGATYHLLGKYERSIQDYDEAIRLKPINPFGYRNRGRAKFLLARFKESANDLEKSDKLQAKDPVTVIWLFLARERAGLDGKTAMKQAAKAADLNVWPGPIIAMFAGLIAPAKLQSRSLEMDPDKYIWQTLKQDEKIRRVQITQANFYIGQYHLLRRSSEKAKASFQSALKPGLTHLLEYEGAHQELARMAK